MSQSFYIPNKKPFWSPKPPAVMTIGKILSLVNGLSICHMQLDDEETANMHATPLSKLECIQVGILGKSGRTFEVFYEHEQDSYAVRVFTPSTRTDWGIAIELIQQLAQHCKSVVVDEEGVKYPSGQITYDYEKNIAFGLQLGMEKKLAFLGVRYPFHFSDSIIERLKNATNQVAEFGDILYKHQHHEAYFAKQQIVQKEEKISGIYVIPPDLPLILPYTPEVEFLIYGKSFDVNEWLAVGMGFAKNGTDRQIIGEINYNTFIQKLSTDKYYFIDDKYILLQALSQQEIIQIFQSPPV